MVWETPASPVRVTARVNANIAVIKYWGKVKPCAALSGVSAAPRADSSLLQRDTTLHLPVNSSLSLTYGASASLCTTTTVVLSPGAGGHSFWLNGAPEEWSNPRLQRCLRGVLARAGVEGEAAQGEPPSWSCCCWCWCCWSWC